MTGRAPVYKVESLPQTSGVWHGPYFDPLPHNWIPTPVPGVNSVFHDPYPTSRPVHPSTLQGGFFYGLPHTTRDGYSTPYGIPDLHATLDARFPLTGAPRYFPRYVEYDPTREKTPPWELPLWNYLFPSNASPLKPIKPGGLAAYPQLPPAYNTLPHPSPLPFPVPHSHVQETPSPYDRPPYPYEDPYVNFGQTHRAVM